MNADRKRRYADYVCRIDGKDYAVVRLPLGGGKYRKKVKLLSTLGGTQADAAQWARDELIEHQTAELFYGVRTGEITFDEFKERIKIYERFKKKSE